MSFRLPLHRSGTGCTELSVIHSSFHFTSPVSVSCVCIFQPKILPLPALHHIPAGDRCASNDHWKSSQPVTFANMQPKKGSKSFSGLLDLTFSLRFLSFLSLEAPQSPTILKCKWTNVGIAVFPGNQATLITYKRDFRQNQ